MSTWSCTVSICKTWSNVQIVADTAEQAEEMAGQMNDVDLNKLDPEPNEEMTVDELECVDECEEEDEETEP